MAGSNPNGVSLGGNSSLSPTSLFGNPSTFTAAANTQGSDYDKIMAQYDALAKSSTTNPISFNPATTTQVGQSGSVGTSPVGYNSITPQLSNYSQSGDVTNSLSGLSDLATTGGYSAANIADIRARDISPIRSIYANAQQNAERAKALSGGYSPNFNATQAKMARDESDKIGDVTTNANAGIAQNVASNRLSAAPAYASASASANAAKTAADARNADIINQINQANTQGQQQANEFNANEMSDMNKFNASLASSTAEANANRATSTSQFNVQGALDAAKANRGTTQGALQGMTSLYGTTPAMTSLFGNQVMQANQSNAQQQQLDNQKLGVISGSSRYGVY